MFLRRWGPLIAAAVAIVAFPLALVAGNAYRPIRVVFQVPDIASALDARGPTFVRHHLRAGDHHTVGVIVENRGSFAVTLVDVGREDFENGYFLLHRPQMLVAPRGEMIRADRAVRARTVKVEPGERRLILVRTEVVCPEPQLLRGASTFFDLSAEQRFGPFAREVRLPLPFGEEFDPAECQS